MKTIARSRTKFIAKLKTEFTDCTVYDPSSGDMIPVNPLYAWQALAFNRRSRLVESTDGDEYTVQVHSNLFYKLRREATS